LLFLFLVISQFIAIQFTNMATIAAVGPADLLERANVGRCHSCSALWLSSSCLTSSRQADSEVGDLATIFIPSSSWASRPRRCSPRNAGDLPPTCSPR
jgi:hypothetical protein